MPIAAPSRPSAKAVLYRSAAIALGAAVFVIDTFSPLESAVAVLYVIVLLLVAGTLSRNGILAFSLACTALSLLSFGITHAADPSFSQIARLCIAIAAIAITTALLIRDHQSRSRLRETNQALARSEWRYRSIFERSRMSLWEQDFSRAIAILEGLRTQGVKDIAAYSAQTPTFLQSVTDAITMIGVNDAMVEVLGASSREQAFAPLTAFHPDPATVLEVLQAIYDGKDHYEGQGTLTGLDGAEKVVLMALSFPPDVATTGRVVGTLVDVTQREKAQQALMAAQEELARASRAATVGALSASIAHELNQPLGAIVMNAQTCLRWLRKDPPDIASAAAAAERVVGAGLRASAIVEETRNVVTRRQPRDEPVDLQRLVQEAVDLLEREIDAHGAKVSTAVAAGVPPIMADRVSLQQVLVNLVTNALHAMASTPPDRREVEISIDRADQHIRLAVRDRGAGISDDDLSRVFEPFFTTREGGMGMGLAISRMAVESGGGRLTASNHKDGGALFECLLPAAREAEG